jgi:DnaJ-class molecular chaperone
LAQDPYQILGVAKDASSDTIRKAYRKLAKTHHPDLNPGNKSAEEKFKAVASAYDILSDEAKRARFDRGEIDETGAERPPRQSYREYADTAQGRRYGSAQGGGHEWHHTGAGANEDFADIFADLFGEAQRGARAPDPRGANRLYSLDASFLDTVNGATRRLELPDGKSIEVKIPAGIEDGQTIRLKGLGDPGRDGAPAGDAMITIHVLPHPHFRRDGTAIEITVPVTLSEAVLGGKIAVPTPTGAVSVTVPPNAATGTKLRLRGRGVAAHGSRPAGDLFVVLSLVIDPKDEGLASFLRNRKDAPAFDPRAALMGAMA